MHSRAQFVFSLGEGGSDYFPNVFPSGSYWVPNMFPIAPCFIPYPLPSVLILLPKQQDQNKDTTAYMLWARPICYNFWGFVMGTDANHKKNKMELWGYPQPGT